MSRASKLTLGATSLFAAATVVFVHFQQKAEQAVLSLRLHHFTYLILYQLTPKLQAMHQGVIRDMEQQRIKRERQEDFDAQRALELEYKRHQTVHDSPASEAEIKAPP
ncbi:hypothetical protein CP533_1205 [Ophiocordyceps camponoti-saundersi (nom. inval.)]|nr:hypothetical protein CP533_1205 [Ophiocordyceps camponoti-saundersi (nom. inval.)]